MLDPIILNKNTPTGVYYIVTFYDELVKCDFIRYYKIKQEYGEDKEYIARYIHPSNEYCKKYRDDIPHIKQNKFFHNPYDALDYLSNILKNKNTYTIDKMIELSNYIKLNFKNVKWI